jgi:hypothetical protein
LDDKKYFEVTLGWDASFYSGMIGKLIGETEKSYLLEFKLKAELGNYNRVNFLKHQVKEWRG